MSTRYTEPELLDHLKICTVLDPRMKKNASEDYWDLLVEKVEEMVSDISEH